jgi:hypothetical protein
MRTASEQANFDLVCKVEDDLGHLVQRHGFASITEDQRHFYAIWCLDADVNNGGFDQYFFNSAGDYCADALLGLRAIGAERAADILAQALALFPGPGPSPEREARQLQLERFTESEQEALEDLNNQFYERADDLERLLAQHARARLTRS